MPFVFVYNILERLIFFREQCSIFYGSKMFLSIELSWPNLSLSVELYKLDI